MIRRSTLAILVIFILLLAGTLVWQNQKKNAPPTPTPTSSQQTLFDPASKVVLLHLAGPNGEIVEVQRNNNGAWQLNWPKAEQTDSAAVDTAVNQLLSLQVLSTLDQMSPASFDATGVSKPGYVITLKLDNGQQVILSIGMFTQNDNGRYVLSSDRKLYVVDRNGLDQVLALLVHPPVMVTTTPAVTPSLEAAPASGTATPVSVTVEPVATPTP